MLRNFEIFERFADGATLWRASSTGIQDTQETLTELSKETENECYAMNLQTGKIIARMKNEADLGEPTRASSKLPLRYVKTKKATTKTWPIHHKIAPIS
jgi:hypothetical protein